MSAQTEASDALVTYVAARAARHAAAVELIDCQQHLLLVQGTDDTSMAANLDLLRSAEEDAMTALLTKLEAVEVVLPEE